jgi:extracellular solute-binding protein (family 5)
MRKTLLLSLMIKLLVVFTVTVSLASLPGALTRFVDTPKIGLVHATATQVSSNPLWIPAGPETNTEQVSIFTSPSGELNGLLAGSIDFFDTPLSPQPIQCPPNCGGSFYVTVPQGDHFYREVEFDLSNNFWGCSMDYGNSLCGRYIRQAWAHLVDKNTFVTTGPCVSQCMSLDNPVPQSVDPNTPISCGWDTTYSGSSTSNCQAGYFGSSSQTVGGGIAYNCITSGAACPTGASTGNCGGSTCYRPWMRTNGSPDFCAAANLLVKAFALLNETVTLNPDCTFTSIPASAILNPINFFVRDDPSRNDLGVGMAMTMCAIFGQGYVEGCTTSGGPIIVSSTTSFPTGSILTVMPQGTITTFPGFTTCVAAGNVPCAPLNEWWMYTAGFQTGSAYDTMYYGYNGQFVSAPTGETPNPCAATTSTSAAYNYMYYCDQVFDSYSAQVEYAPCSSAAVGQDPTPGQNSATLTFGACGGFGFSPTDFVLSAGTIVNGALLGSRFNVPITLTSIGGFSGAIAFSASSDNTAIAKVSPASEIATLGAGWPSSTTSILAGVNTTSTVGTAHITATGTVGSTSHSITLTVTVSSSTSVTSVGATRLSPETAQYLTQDEFGRTAATIPVFSGIIQLPYLAPPTACATTGSDCDVNGWHRVINAEGASIFNFFTWLDAWNACPRAGGVPCAPGSAMVQGFSYTTSHLSPYQASTVHDFAILGNIYDGLYRLNPYAPTQVMDWMTLNHNLLTNSQLTYAPPSGTTTTIRNNLRHDLFWQDGQQVTAYDVAFTYISMIAIGSPIQFPLSLISGITILSKYSFDINLYSPGPFTESNVGSVTIIPGHLWSSCASTWSSFIAGQTLPSSVLPSSGGCWDTTTTMASPSFDPISSGVLIGSGAFECQNTGANTAKPVGDLGTGCSNTNTQNPTGSFTLTRFGCSLTSVGTSCVSPASAPMLLYNRAASDLALYIWSGMTGNSVSDFNTLSTAISCEGAPVGTAACVQWQQGIGNPNGDGVTSGVIGLLQDAIFRRYYTVGWTSPYSWTSLTGIEAFPPVMYEGSATLNPAPVSGHPCNTAGSTFNNGAGYNC